MIRLETHCHTKYSKDSMLPFSLLYLKCRLCHINWIAVTEHNNIQGAIEFKKYCEKKKSKLHVIIGEEIMTFDGEVIGLFLKEEIPLVCLVMKQLHEFKNKVVLYMFLIRMMRSVLRQYLKKSVLKRMHLELIVLSAIMGVTFQIHMKLNKLKLPINII